MATTSSKKNIFVSYRVKDTQLATGRLTDALKQYIDEGRIFMDIDKIEPGYDFTQVISKYLDSSEIMLAIIGPDWMAHNPEKNSYRIHDPNDWVRKEVASALKRNIRVIPVLIDGAEMPSDEQLPDDLKPLLLRQAFEISNKRWKYDSEQLINTLLKNLGEKPIDALPQNSYSPSSITTKPQQNNAKKYWIWGLAALLLIWIIVSVSKKEDKVDNPDPQPIENKKDVSLNNNSNKEGEELPNTPVEVKDVTGTWQDPVGKGRFIMSQTGKQIKLNVYSIAEEQTGSGSGEIEGNHVVFQANLYLMGQKVPCALNLTLSPSQETMSGEIKIEENGAAYTEKLKLEKL